MPVAANQSVEHPLLQQHGITLVVRREDQVYPGISGNKYRKLRYNFMEAKKTGHKQLLTFGGAFSNHIAAVAYAGREQGFQTVGVIRGEELADTFMDNPTLAQAHGNGMRFHFVSRAWYRQKDQAEQLAALRNQWGRFYCLPEGGSNALAVKGCEEILGPGDQEYQYICCPVGTGGTLAGLANASGPDQRILGFAALKGDFLNGEIRKFTRQKNWQLVQDYHLGGYAKLTDSLVGFINTFKKEWDIPLDPIYTGKMFYGIFDMVAKGHFKKGSRILAVHTGGLQGILGMNQRLQKQGRPCIAL